MIIGTLVKLIIPIDSVDKHETIGIMINGEVKPLASVLWEKQYELQLLERIERMKKNKKPNIKIRDNDNEIIIKNNEFNYNYYMNGWESNDEYYNDSGVIINDTFQKPEPKKGKQKEDFWDLMQPYFGNNVEIELIW